MAIVKKIAFAGLLGMIGLVLYRFGRIVARVVSAEIKPKAKSSAPKPH